MTSAQERLLITGAGGWLGKSLLANLSKLNFSDYLFVGEKSRIIQIEGTNFIQESWTLDKVSKFNPTSLIHLAAITRDKLSNMDEEEYNSRYQTLHSNLYETLSLPSLRKGIIFSSGAADLESFPENSSDPYSVAKRKEEDISLSFGSTKESISVVRVYSVTGRFNNKIQKLAFSNMIYQAKYYKEIRVKAKNKVLRQFIDAEELMLRCADLLKNDHSAIYSSGGVKIELLELARYISDFFHLENNSIKSEIDNTLPFDDYTSNKNLVPGTSGNSISSIKEQIKISSLI